MSPGSSTESYPAFARIGLRENPGKNLNQITCPDRDSNPGHLVSQPDALTVTPQLLEDILFIDSNFKIVSKSIILLESSKLQLSEVLNIVDKVSQTVIQNNNSLISEKVKSSQSVLCSSEASFETGVRLECVRSCEHPGQWTVAGSPEFECSGPQLGDLSSKFSGLSLKIETVTLNSVSILETLNSVLEHVKNLENEVAYLKSENAALKLQVSEIITSNSNCSKSGGYRERPSAKLYSTAVQPAQKKISADPARSAVVELPVASRAVDHVPAVSTVSSPAVTEIVDSLPDGFQVVTHKRRKREPRVGTRNATGIEMAPERAKTKSLFVSRFGPNVSISNIKDSLTQQSTLANQININFLKGSTLGPLLFLLFIDDICKPICSHYLLFADDLKIFRKINSLADCHLLQNDIHAIQRWSDYNAFADDLAILSHDVITVEKQIELLKEKKERENKRNRGENRSSDILRKKKTIRYLEIPKYMETK
ncbi:hypothetical protein ANN_25388 [Periplaneta americana]|uniref:Reverse transcriptase domain-containing protein n=1 Tax=Periplaneta americana TaxID=6978 RepID=A0ABQ8S166_PERAM|nr:hypothetical protein ANN_25388 [Periplaneta americana]